MKKLFLFLKELFCQTKCRQCQSKIEPYRDKFCSQCGYPTDFGWHAFYGM